MRKWVISFLAVCFLTGCDASTEIERGMTLRSSLLQGSESRFQTKVTAEYPDKIHSFSMDCIFDEQGNLTFSVTEPDSISGITGNITSGKGALTFDDTVLYFSLLTDDQISPISAPWILMKTLRSGCLTAACMDENLLHLTIDDSFEDDALKLDIWINENNQPISADILYKNRRILSMEIINFDIL